MIEIKKSKAQSILFGEYKIIGWRFLIPDVRIKTHTIELHFNLYLLEIQERTIFE